MKSLTYTIQFHSFWHASSGLSGSTYAATLVNKSRKGLPFIPGKTLKGLLREAAEILHELDPQKVTAAFITEVFGDRSPIENPDARRPAEEKIEANYSPGTCHFSSAHLSQALQQQIQETQKPHLYQVLSSTRINKDGLAENKTLRSLEVSVPLTLFAEIGQFPQGDDYRQQMNFCMQWTKRMGLNRSRGLGRCQFQIIP